MQNNFNSSSSNLCTLEELFAERFFKVPDYQRGYSWEESQLTDLKKDIENLIGKEHNHFTGTIVITETDPSTNSFEIVDGQQRLTTLVILMSTIIKSNPNDYAQFRQRYILRGEIGNEIPVLKLNEETNEYFNDVIIKNGVKKPEIKSHQCIQNAKEYFEKWLTENSDIVHKIFDVITKQLGFLLFTPANTKEIGIMFEVINNRGKSLSQLEKIKNYFIYFSAVHEKRTLRDMINSKWIEIQRNLSYADKTSNDEEDSFLRYCYLVFFDINKEKSWHVYDQLKCRFDVNEHDKTTIDDYIKEIQEFLEFLVNASRHYACFFSSNYFKDKFKLSGYDEIGKQLSFFRCQPVNASIMPLYLAIMNMLESANHERISNLLEILEKVNFRIYILPKVTSRADSKQGDMFWFANSIFHNQNWNSEDGNRLSKTTKYNNKEIKGDILDWAEQQLIQITKYHCNEEEFVKSLTIDDGEPENYYLWNGIRYFLANYEVHLHQKISKHSWNIENILKTRKEAGKDTNDYLSREHIWALEDPTTDFPSDYVEKRRLGNFVLIGFSLNVQLSNDSIPEKIKTLSNKNSSDKEIISLLQVKELNTISGEVENDKRVKYNKQGKIRNKNKNYYRDMSKIINDTRETKMIEFALKRWRLPGETFNKFVKVDSFEKEKEKEKYILKNK